MGSMMEASPIVVAEGVITGGACGSISVYTCTSAFGIEVSVAVVTNSMLGSYSTVSSSSSSLEDSITL